MRRTLSCISLILLAVAVPTWAQSTLDKGHRILIERGLQLSGLTTPFNFFHMETYRAAGLTTVAYGYDTSMDLLGSAPGVPWSRWVNHTTQNDLPDDEQPYKQNLVSLSVGDEQYIDSASNMDATVNWFTANAGKFPNTILYTNQWGSEASPTAMRELNTRAHPDMLSFDTYPFGFTSPNQWYTDAAKYQALGKEFGIPVGFYLQTYHSSDEGARDPSSSEMRWNQFAGWTFGFKSATAFVYNAGASSLFTPVGVTYSGDTMPTALYPAFAETSRQSRNLGPALVHLDSTDVRFIPGFHMQGATPVVNGIPTNLSNWSAGAGADPYITAVAVRTSSDLNSGLKGDVLLGFFKVLQEDMDGPAANEKYFMVTNGLIDPNGTPTATKQTVDLTFNFTGTTLDSLLRLSRLTGLEEVVPLIALGNNMYKLTLVLDGGTGDLFKYNDGVSFPAGNSIPEPASLALVAGAALFILPRRR
jgi:hypothetical protein